MEKRARADAKRARRLERKLNPGSVDSSDDPDDTMESPDEEEGEGVQSVQAD